MSDWRPIETAPKDGTPVLGYCQPRYVESGKPMSFSYQAIIWWRGERYGDSQWKWRLHHSDSAVEPTHWQPLPAPPEDRP